ncbi:ATP-grasp domain-containing protein [Streptococcus suis]
MFIKPNSGYCSIGVDHLSKCHLNQETCDLLDKRVETYQQEFIVQRFIEGVEYEVPFFVDYSGQIHVLPPIRIHHNEQKDFLDFHDVLTDEYTFSIETDSEILSTLNQVVSKAVSFLRFDKFGRIDIRYSQGKAYIFDINTYPHYIEHSSFYKSMHSIYKENTLDIIMKLLLGNLFPDF